MTNNGYTPSFFDYSRTFLPELPQNVKNRNMERSRQALRTSNEEYGKHWNPHTQSAALPPTYLTDPTPESIAAASRWYRSPSSRFGPRLWTGDDYVGPDLRYVVDYRRNGSHRNGYDLISNAYLLSGSGGSGSGGGGGFATDRPEWYGTNTGTGSSGVDRLQRLSTYRNGPPQMWANDEDRVQRYRYKLTISDRDRRGSTAAADGNWTLADISRVDLQVHLNDESVVNVADVPFYYQ